MTDGAAGVEAERRPGIAVHNADDRAQRGCPKFLKQKHLSFPRKPMADAISQTEMSASPLLTCNESSVRS